MGARRSQSRVPSRGSARVGAHWASAARLRMAVATRWQWRCPVPGRQRARGGRAKTKRASSCALRRRGGSEVRIVGRKKDWAVQMRGGGPYVPLLDGACGGFGCPRHSRPGLQGLQGCQRGCRCPACRAGDGWSTAAVQGRGPSPHSSCRRNSRPRSWAGHVVSSSSSSPSSPSSPFITGHSSGIQGLRQGGAGGGGDRCARAGAHIRPGCARDTWPPRRRGRPCAAPGQASNARAVRAHPY
jgi:hypothetical protein